MMAVELIWIQRDAGHLGGLGLDSDGGAVEVQPQIPRCARDDSGGVRVVLSQVFRRGGRDLGRPGLACRFYRELLGESRISRVVSLKRKQQFSLVPASESRVSDQLFY